MHGFIEEVADFVQRLRQSDYLDGKHYLSNQAWGLILPADGDETALQRVFGTIQYVNLSKRVVAERYRAILVVRVKERQWYCTAGTKQRHTVVVTDVADIRHGAYDRVFFTTAERNRLMFQLPYATVLDMMDIIVQV